MTVIRNLILAAVFVGASALMGGEYEIRQPDGSTTIVRFSNPISRLPKGIDAKKGELTLYADYVNGTDKGVPVYLINRTGKPIDLNTQGWDVYVKLEYEVAPGQWKRAQPHAYSFCGNSYSNDRLEDESFAAQTGYVPAKGQKATVRYRVYQKDVRVASNFSTGIVDKQDIDRAANDAMAVYTGDFDFVAKVASGEIRLNNQMDHVRDLRMAAIRRLGEFADHRDEAERILKECMKSENENHVSAATGAMARLAESAKDGGEKPQP